MTESHLIEPDQLAMQLNDPNLMILEAGFALPGMADDLAAFQNQHLPKARFFDIEKIADTDNPLPHMVPSAADFASAVGMLGVSNNSFVVCYDRFGLFSAGRVWWMFRLFGHDQVVILNGGMKRWTQLGLPLEDANELAVTPTTFCAEFRPELYATKDDIYAALSDSAPIVDARPLGRFEGHNPEPRKGMRAGHMPGALNVSFLDLTDPDTGMLRPIKELRDLFSDVPQDAPITYSCGSGITAAALMFTGELLGRTGRVYDGSWAEWGSLSGVSIVRGE